MSDAEAYLIMRTLADNVKTYDQVVELLSYLMPHSGGLLPLGFGLFHHKESIREATVDLFNHLRQYPVGVLFLQTLNHFQRYAYAAHHPQPSAYAPPMGRAHSSASAAISISDGYFGERINGAL
ncbi:hypothetical protein MPER_04294 [Moniliophthora perniciosa FA553]|nr:hypothetical protein MPER_04294 [Moniliophthora perniciosa FA553]